MKHSDVAGENKLWKKWSFEKFLRDYEIKYGIEYDLNAV